MKARYLFFTFSFLLFTFSSFCQYDSIRPQGIYGSNFIIDEKSRDITYYMPLRYGKEETYSLLIVLHDEKSNAKSLIKKYGDIIHAKADSANCIVLYPDALGGYWNDKVKPNIKDSVNDVGFISIMLEFFVRQFGCDITHVYLSGIGNGGNLCYRFTCESIHKPLAVAAINATADKNSFVNCRNQKIIPVVNIESNIISKAEMSKAMDFLFAQHNDK